MVKIKFSISASRNAALRHAYVPTYLLTYTYACECQVLGILDFVYQYALPVIIFAYCYARIFHTIRRQNKVVTGHVGRTQDVPMATTSRDPNARQVQQQATGATTGAKLSRTEMNVIKTMIAVIVCFIVCWTPGSFVVTGIFITVSLLHLYIKFFYYSFFVS